MRNSTLLYLSSLTTRKSNMGSTIVEAAIKAGLGNQNDFTICGDHLDNSKTGKRYFAKSQTNVSQLLGEAEGLKRISLAAPGLAPRIHVAEVTDHGKRALFISDYITLGNTSSSSTQSLARKMANELHNPEKHSMVKQYGFPVPTHCGNTEQDNTWE